MSRCGRLWLWRGTRADRDRRRIVAGKLRLLAVIRPADLLRISSASAASWLWSGKNYWACVRASLFRLLLGTAWRWPVRWNRWIWRSRWWEILWHAIRRLPQTPVSLPIMCYMYRRRRYCHSPVVGLTGPASCRYPPIQTGLNRWLDRILDFLYIMSFSSLVELTSRIVDTDHFIKWFSFFSKNSSFSLKKYKSLKNEVFELVLIK